jgi:predicted Zn-dependent protease
MVATAIEDLRAGRFEEALVELEPARSETAADGFAALLASQAQFGVGKYFKAAQSLRTALKNLPQDRWGQTVVDHAEYFGSSDRYMKHLYALASHVRQHPTDRAAHFLLGWHLGFLGHTTGATRELQAAIELGSQRDELAGQLLAHSPIAADSREQNPANAAPKVGVGNRQPSARGSLDEVRGQGKQESRRPPTSALLALTPLFQLAVDRHVAVVDFEHVE